MGKNQEIVERNVQEVVLVCKWRDGGLSEEAARLARPAVVPVLIRANSLIRADVQALINALERQAEALDIADQLGSKYFGRALISLMREDHRLVVCAATDDVHGLTGGSANGILGVEIPSDNSITTRVKIVDFLLVVVAIRRAEESWFTGEGSASEN